MRFDQDANDDELEFGTDPDWESSMEAWALLADERPVSSSVGRSSEPQFVVQLSRARAHKHVSDTTRRARRSQRSAKVVQLPTRSLARCSTTASHHSASRGSRHLGRSLLALPERVLLWASHRRRAIARYYTWVGLSLSLGIAISAVGRQFGLAALLLVCRVVGSIFVGGGPLTIRPPIDDIAERRTREVYGSAPRAVWGCVASHVCDAVILFACGVGIAAERPYISLVVAACACVALIGTLARVAPAQVAVVVHRSSWERFIRLGGLLVGFLLAAMGTLPDTQAVLVAGLPAGAFGLAEFARMILSQIQTPVVSIYVAGFTEDGATVSEGYYQRPPHGLQRRGEAI